MYEHYIQFLTFTFGFFSIARVFSYIPTILKLRRHDACAKNYSQITWTLFTISNLTFGLMLYENHNHQLDSLVLVPLSNAILCLITSFYIWKLQSSDPTHENDFVHLYKDTVREVKAIYKAFKKKHKTEAKNELNNNNKGEQYES
jgi:hypothetical protein